MQNKERTLGSFTPIKDWNKIEGGIFFFHSTDAGNLTSIRKIGLVPPKVHQQGKTYPQGVAQYQMERDDLLFIATQQRSALLSYRSKQGERKGNKVIFRFQRDRLELSELFEDASRPAGDYPVIWLATTGTIEPKDLEICDMLNEYEDECKGEECWRPLLQ